MTSKTNIASIKRVKNIYAFVNNKGGVGKTFLSVNLASELHRRGYKILLIDMDSQKNATIDLPIAEDLIDNNNTGTIYDLLFEDAKIEDCIINVGSSNEMFHMIIGDERMNRAVVNFLYNPMNNNIGVLNNILCAAKTEEKYDFILIDSPPTLDAVVANILNAAHHCIVPLLTESNSFEGLLATIKAIESAKNNLTGTSVELSGIIINSFSKNTIAGKTIHNALTENFPDMLYRTTISKSTIAEQSITTQTPVCYYDSSLTKLKDDLSNFCDEFLERRQAFEKTL